MTRALIAAAALVALAAVAWLLIGHGAPVTQTARGAQVYADFCARCHGAHLEGQPDWETRLPNGRMPAPPHDETGHTWHHPDQDLFRIVKEGVAAIVPGYQTDMPAFGGVLSDEEIVAALAFIKGTWAEEQQAYQAARTAHGAAD